MIDRLINVSFMSFGRRERVRRIHRAESMRERLPRGRDDDSIVFIFSFPPWRSRFTVFFGYTVPDPYIDSRLTSRMSRLLLLLLLCVCVRAALNSQAKQEGKTIKTMHILYTTVLMDGGGKVKGGFIIKVRL